MNPTGLKYFLFLIIFGLIASPNMLTGQNLDENEPDNKTSSATEEEANLFDPIEFLPAFRPKKILNNKKYSLKLLEDKITENIKSLSKSWLRRSMFNELFVLAKSRKSQFIAQAIKQYFENVSNLDWRASDFEAIPTQFELKEGAKFIENLILNQDFDFDPEFKARMPYIFVYQKAYSQTELKLQVIEFLKLIQSKLMKPEKYNFGNYYLLNLLRLASGDSKILEDVQNWLYKISINREESAILDKINFKSVLLSALMKSLTVKNSEYYAWLSVCKLALEQDVITVIDKGFAETLNSPEFVTLDFAEKVKLIPSNTRTYYALTASINGNDEALKFLGNSVSGISQLSNFAAILEPFAYSKNYVKKILLLFSGLYDSPAYNVTYTAKESLGKLVAFADSKDKPDFRAYYEKIMASTRRKNEKHSYSMLILFNAAACNDEILFNDIFKSLYSQESGLNIEQLFNELRNQFHKAGKYLNSDAKIMLGNKLLSIISKEMPFSVYSIFDVLKEFATEKEIADKILDKIPYWYTNGNVNSRIWFFTYTGAQTAFNRIAIASPEKTAKLFIPLFNYVSRNERINERVTTSIIKTLVNCGGVVNGYFQQKFEAKHKFLYLLSIAQTKQENTLGYLFREIGLSAAEFVNVEFIEKVLKTCQSIIPEENIGLVADFLVDVWDEKIRLSALLSTIYILATPIK